MYLKKAIHGTIVVFIYTILAGLLWYLFRTILARNLSVAEYGLFFAVYSFIAFFQIFTDFGLPQSVSKHMIDLKEKNKRRSIKSLVVYSLYFQLILSIIIYTAFVLSAAWLSNHYFNANATTLIVILGIWFLTMPLTIFFQNIFLGFQRPGLVASIDLLRSLSVVLISSVLLYVGMGIKSPVIAYLCVNFIIILIYAPFVKKLFPDFTQLKAKFDKRLMKSVLTFGFMVSFSGVIWTVLTQTDTLILTYFRTMEEVGLYQIAVPLANLLLYAVIAINLVAYPMVAELSARKDEKKLSQGINLFYKYIFMLVIPIVVVIFSFSDLVINILFGSKYIAAAAALKILIISALFSSLTLFNNSVLSAIGHPKTVAKTMSIAAVLNLCLNLYFVPKYGIVGASGSTMTSFILALFLSTNSLRKRVRVYVPLKSWALTFLVGGLTAFFIYYIKEWLNINMWGELALIGVLAGILYFGVLYLLRILDIEEIKGIVRTLLEE